ATCSAENQFSFRLVSDLLTVRCKISWLAGGRERGAPLGAEAVPVRCRMRTSESAVSNRQHLFVRAWLIAALTVASHGVGPAQRGGEKPLFDRWANARAPIPGPAAPIGFYSAGCLQGAEALPLDGTGYAVMHPSRHRFYGHPALVSYLTELAKRTHAEN